MLDGLVDAAVLVDRDQTVVAFNQAYVDVTGLSNEEIVERVSQGVRCNELLPLNICQTQCSACHVRETSRPIKRDNVLDKTIGKNRSFIVATTPLEDGMVLETFRMVTESARTSKLFIDTEKADLEKEVKARTEELRQAHQHLMLQEKMASLGRLIAGIAHELNNPINFVMSNVDFVQKYIEDLLALVRIIDDDTELPRRFTETFEAHKKAIDYDFLQEDCIQLMSSLREGVERSANIVRDLKEFSRTNRQDFSEVDVIKDIEATLNIIAPSLEERISVKRNYMKNIPLIVGNAGHLRQVFMNLLVNAVQAIEGEGQILINVSLWEKRGILVTVSDSGVGIQEADFQKILDPFYTTKEVGKGTGLGLWITQNVVREHGGELVVANLDGQGASFEVRLPFKPPSIIHPQKSARRD